MKDASRQQLQDLFDAASDQHEFLVRTLPEYLETSLAIINCRSAQATALGQAIASVEAYSEVPMDEKGHSQSLILQFFLTRGVGENMLIVARAVYSEREDETINETLVMANVQDSSALKNNCVHEKCDLDELLKHVDATNALLARTTLQKPLNTIQKANVQQEFQELQNLSLIHI